MTHDQILKAAADVLYDKANMSIEAKAWYIANAMETAMADDLDFEIDGPDGDGFVWIRSSEGQNVWARNLGRQDDVAEKFSQWLGSIDYLEQG